MQFPYKPTTENDRRSLLSEIFFSLQSKITKISEGSGISGLLASIARLGGKVEKDLAVYMARLYPTFASGVHLDDSAEVFGISPRSTGSKATVYLKIFAQQNTQYLASTHQFKSSSGNSYELLENHTVGASGVLFVLVRSVLQGSVGNSDPLTINQVTPVPVGHLLVTNEVAATGGQDLENDLSLRARILGVSNMLSKNTPSYLEQIMMKFQPLVSKVYSNGLTSSGLIDLKILTWSGQPLTELELSDLSEAIGPYLSLRDSNHFQSITHSVQLTNVEFFPIDIELRVQLSYGSNIEIVRRQMQSNISKILSPDQLSPGRTIQWEDLYLACKSVSGVNLIPVEYFSYQSDYLLDRPRFPKLRGFILRDLSGVLLTSINSETNRLYRSQLDIDFQQIALA